MSFNLIREAWIPARRADGTRQVIAPWQVTSGIGSSPVVSLDAARPDFNGGLIQFLIGLVQTALPPANDRVWRQGLTNPPDENALKAGMESVAHAFDLDGDGPRFMQELALRQDKKAKIWPISYLLIDAPTENTRKENRDHFVKREQFEDDDEEPRPLCLPCAAAALFTLQDFAPTGGSGGGGKFTSLRGGGPLSTVIIGDDLWRTIWLNVLAKSAFQAPRELPLEYTFPWLAPEKFVEAKTNRSISSEDMCPLHVFWNMPRRVLLDFEEGGRGVACMACGERAPRHVFRCRDATRGMHYFQESGREKRPSWIHPPHPLTPYHQDRDGNLGAVHGSQVGLVGYRHWLGWIIGDEDSRPATVVHECGQRQIDDLKETRLWAFGYHMDQMTAMRWHEGVMPLLQADGNIRGDLEDMVRRLIRTAREVARNTLRSGRWALYGKVDNAGRWKMPKHVRQDRALFRNAEDRFWLTTETDFYSALEIARRALLAGQTLDTAKECWLTALVTKSERVFDELSQFNQIGITDPKRITLAWQRLLNSLRSPRIREILDLPREDAGADSAGGAYEAP